MRLNLLQKRVVNLSLALALAFAAGCGTGASEQSSSEKSGGAEQRVVKHAMGETKLKGTPKRVVVLTNDATDDALALGVKPVGAVKSWIGKPYYDFLSDDLKGVKPVGDEVQPNLEAIAALKPDLIIGSKIRHEKIYKQLSGIAPTVYSETVGHVWKDNFKLYAEALNKEDEADKWLQEWDEKIADFKQKHKRKLDSEVSIVRFLPGMVRIHHNMFPDSIVKEAGLQRPKAQQKDEFYTEVTEERIPDMEGDVMFVLTMEMGDGEASKLEKEWMNKPLFKKLDVAKKGNVHKVNDVYWNLSGGVQGAERTLEDLDKHISKL